MTTTSPSSFLYFMVKILLFLSLAIASSCNSDGVSDREIAFYTDEKPVQIIKTPSSSDAAAKKSAPEEEENPAEESAPEEEENPAEEAAPEEDPEPEPPKAAPPAPKVETVLTEQEQTKTFTVQGQATNKPIRMLWLMDSDANVMNRYRDSVTTHLNKLVKSLKDEYAHLSENNNELFKVVLASKLHQDAQNTAANFIQHGIILNNTPIYRYPSHCSSILQAIQFLIDREAYSDHQNNNNGGMYANFFSEKRANFIVAITQHHNNRYNYNHNYYRYYYHSYHGSRYCCRYYYAYPHGSLNPGIMKFLNKKFDSLDSFRFYGILDKEYDINNSYSYNGNTYNFTSLASKLNGEIFDLMRWNRLDRNDEMRNKADEWRAAFAKIRRHLVHVIEQPVNEFLLGQDVVGKPKIVKLNDKILYPNNYQFNGSYVKINAPVTKGDKVEITFVAKIPTTTPPAQP